MTDELHDLGGGFERRTFVKGAVAAGALVWAAPAVVSVGRAAAAVSPAGCGKEIQYSGDLPDVGESTDGGSGQDAFTFDTTQPNTLIQVTVTPDPTTDPEFGIYQGSGTGGVPLLAVDNFGTGQSETGNVLLAAVGTYTV